MHLNNDHEDAQMWPRMRLSAWSNYLSLLLNRTENS